MGTAESSPVQEGQSTLFVRRTTGIPVPTVYAFFRDDKTLLEVVILEYISGEGLDSLWPRLDQPASEAMLTTLRAYLDELRRLPSSGYYGCPWAQSHILPTLINCLVTGYRRDEPACKTHDQWIDRMMGDNEFTTTI
ncbi:hypothetical protein B0H67DRAFT_558658 [Lasiosphaeris hirsuta]|uniref:Aminoglycoside phosphotransferase domain-containing protein n=1 Tax=Lasiosphaeris hirsuta TaxID=260670 RepID=A0AA40DIV4_9PEZI|nr:hypothetical protein B0H67DRAFT_558658 [Lasiosphaeris hirsuta]